MQNFLVGLFLSNIVNLVYAQNALKLVPEEYEVSGTSAIGMGFGGVAATSGINAVRTNPALMSSGKEYSAGAGYHWPTAGREFYQAGIVDSKTSTVGAGVNYTSFMNDYKSKADQSFWFDSPVRRRIAVGLSYALPQIALGINGQYIEGFAPDFTEESNLLTKKGWTMGGGASGVIAGVRVASSVENTANKKVQEFAPTIYRIGASFPLTSEITINADYRNRQRIARFEGEVLSVTSLSSAADAPPPPSLAREQLGIVSVNAAPHPNLRLSAGYAQSFADQDFKKRRMLGAGVAIVGQKASLSYQLARPHAEETDDILHSIQLNIEVAL